ncbi:MAG TPA: hypothetical protein VJ810_13030 [Blastocatellia bacterium]|nr:hypothetical protein [Blastocatellia bacterium]
MRSLRITNNIQLQAGARWRRVCGLLAIGIAASLLSVKLLLAVYAAAGDLDLSFGEGGKVEGLPDNSSSIDAVAIQADGKLLAISKSQNSNFLLSRFKNDGSLDSTFGAGGQVETNFGASSTPAAMAIQPDGLIVVAGTKVESGCCPKIVLARYRTTGSLDTSFSTDGMLEIPHIRARGADLVLQSNGKIVVAGTAIYQSLPDPIPVNRSLIVRINEDGSLDSSFGTSGYVVTNIWNSQPGPSEGFSNLVIQGNGKMVASSQGNGLLSRVVRFFANGERDMTFGSNGVFDSAFAEVNQALALQPDGKVVIAVYGASISNHYGLLVRLTADGILDSTFGQGGKTAADPLASGPAVGLQEDGRLVVAGGMNSNSSTSSFRLSRYQSDGSLDTSFGLNGTVTTVFPKPYSYAKTLALYGDGKIVAAGREYTPPNGFDSTPVLARYLNDDGATAPADVQVNRERVTPAPVHPGDIITYTITITNNGPGKAAHVTLTTQTATNTTFESFGAPPGWVVYKRPAPFSSGVVSSSAYELPPGAAVNFYLTVRVRPSIAPGAQISHSSSVSSFMPDPNSANNTTTMTVTVQ